MRTLHFDQFEFETVSSEEEVEFSIQTLGPNNPYESLRDFVRAVRAWDDGTEPLPSPMTFDQAFLLRKYLAMFVGIEAPPDCNWPCYCLKDVWPDLHYVVDAGDRYISYKWSSSA